MKKTFAVTLAVLCLAAAGCSTVGDGAKSLANSVGMYDYPIAFKSSQGVYKRQSWETMFEIKPNAQARLGQILDLVEKNSKPADVQANIFRVLCLVDTNKDREVSVSEAEKGADNAIQLVSDALGDVRVAVAPQN